MRYAYKWDNKKIGKLLLRKPRIIIHQIIIIVSYYLWLKTPIVYWMLILTRFIDRQLTHLYMQYQFFNIRHLEDRKRRASWCNGGGLWRQRLFDNLENQFIFHMKLWTRFFLSGKRRTVKVKKAMKIKLTLFDKSKFFWWNEGILLWFGSTNLNELSLVRKSIVEPIINFSKQFRVMIMFVDRKILKPVFYSLVTTTGVPLIMLFTSSFNYYGITWNGDKIVFESMSFGLDKIY